MKTKLINFISLIDKKKTIAIVNILNYFVHLTNERICSSKYLGFYTKLVILK